MLVALAQINSVVGDLEGNRGLIEDAINQARDEGAAIVALPEMAVTGYPPEDLVLMPSFVKDNRKAVDQMCRSCHGITAIVGFVHAEGSGRLFNAAAILAEGDIKGIYRKQQLPNYGVFDEARYFTPGDCTMLATLGELRLGVTICEDIWPDDGPFEACAAAGAALVININASPYHIEKGRQREELVARKAMQTGAAIAYVNLVGGQDELVFDGQSFAVSSRGQLLARASQFKPELLLVEFDSDSPGSSEEGRPGRRVQVAQNAPPLQHSISDAASNPRPHALAAGEEQTRLQGAGFKAGSNRDASVTILELPSIDSKLHRDRHVEKPYTDRHVEKPYTHRQVEMRIAEALEPDAEVYGALVLGIRDYLQKNGFRTALVGISGGIDSALTATLAADAIGSENVLGVSNPSDITSTQSVEDAETLARNLGIELLVLPVSEPFESILKTLEPVFAGTEPGLAEENIQARIRGLLWMAISNKTRRIVLSTGNKSELSVGYATLYGDMAGGFSVLKDVPKTLVYRLARWRNRQSPVIPESIIERPPTAELSPGQLDTDALPPYEVLDPILEAYVERDLPLEEIAALGFDVDTVTRVAAMVDRAEYKRRQSAPGIKITQRAFGKDRRLPITNRYRRSPGRSTPR